jgi:hypothetical protein
MVKQDSLNFEILTSPQGRRRSWPSESIPSRSQKADHGRPVTINSSRLLPDLFFNFQLSTSHQSRVTVPLFPYLLASLPPYFLLH